MPIDDECNFTFGRGDSASHGLVRKLKISGFRLFDVPRGKCFADLSAKSTECQIRAGRIELSEKEPFAVLPLFLRLNAKS